VFVDLSARLFTSLLSPLLLNHPPNLSSPPENLFSKPFRESVECELAILVLVLIHVFSVASKTFAKKIENHRKTTIPAIVNPDPKISIPGDITSSSLTHRTIITSSLPGSSTDIYLNPTSRFALALARL
jgi:hypothetical protein